MQLVFVNHLIDLKPFLTVKLTSEHFKSEHYFQKVFAIFFYIDNPENVTEC